MSPTRKRVLIALLILLGAAALGAGVYLAITFGLVWALNATILLVVVVGFVAQAGGILSREEP